MLWLEKLSFQIPVIYHVKSHQEVSSNYNSNLREGHLLNYLKPYSLDVWLYNSHIKDHLFTLHHFFFSSFLLGLTSKTVYITLFLTYLFKFLYYLRKKAHESFSNSLTVNLKVVAYLLVFDVNSKHVNIGLGGYIQLYMLKHL